MYSLFYYLNYKCGDNIQKICTSTKITKFMAVFKKLSNIVIREQKILNDISKKLKNDRRFKRLTQNVELSKRLFNNIKNVKTNIQSNQDYKQHYSENGSYGFYEYVRDHQDASNNKLIIQLLNIIFENIENNKNIELYKQINIKPFLDLINDVPVKSRWVLKKIEESPRIQKYLIGRFGTNKDLYNNIKNEITRINKQDMSVTEFRNHLLYNKRKAKQKSKKEKKKINDMYSLFHNIVDQSPEVTNTKEYEYVKVIDLMDLLEKVNQKSKQPEQQRQQQQIIEQLEKNWDIRNIIQNNIELYDKIIKELESHNYVNYDLEQLHPEIAENETDNIIAMYYYLEDQKNNGRNDEDFNEVYSLFNLIKSSVKEEDIEMYNKIEIYEITNTVKTITESVRKKQQQQQGRAQNQNVFIQQQNIQDTQNTNKKLKSEYNTANGAINEVQQRLLTKQQQQNQQTDSLDNVDVNDNYYNSMSYSDCLTNVNFDLDNLNINDIKDNQTINQGQTQINQSLSSSYF